MHFDPIVLRKKGEVPGSSRIHRGFINYCFLIFTGSFVDPAALANDKPQADPPLVTMEAILERSGLRVSNVRWANSNTLIADFRVSGEDKSYTRFLALDGTLGAVLGEGEMSALAPDDTAVLQHTKDGWVLRELQVGLQGIVIEQSEDDEINFSYSAWRPPEWSPDGRYAAIVEQTRTLDKGTSPKPIVVDGVSIIDFDKHSSALRDLTTRISIIDRATATTLCQFVIPGIGMQFAWSADDSLYISQVRFNETEPSTSLLRFNTRCDKPQRIYRTPGRFQSMRPAIHPDGNCIALAIDADNRKWDDFVSIVLIDAKTGEEDRRLTHDLPIAGDDYHWSADGTEIYARVRHGGLDEIWAIPLDGEPRPLAKGPRRHFDLALSPDGRKLSYQTEDGYGRKDIRILELENGEEKIVYIVDEPAKEFRLGNWRQIQWNSTDGVHPYGYLITPPGFDPDRQYPMLVDVHGGGPGSRLYLMGPFTISIAKGPLEWHAWAARGYVVFLPNYRSTGDYGPNVIAARYKKGELSAVDDVQDIASGVRHVISQGFIDRDRVAILGHSAGGARVYLILTRYSELFAAAIINEGTNPDPLSMFINSTTGAYVGGYRAGIFSDLLGGTLDQVSNRYKVNFIFDAYRIKTPTLILMGNEEKGGVNHMPYEVVYSILREYRVPARMLSFVEEGHTYKNPATVRLVFKEARKWLDTHMPANEEARTR